jgi:hypothetical protein
MGRGTGVAGLVVCLLLALCAPAAIAAGDDGLVPARGDLPGYRAAGTGAAIARGAFAARLPASVRHDPAVGAGFRDGGQTLAFGVLSAASPRRASAALRTLRHGRRAVSLGHGVRGLVRDRSGTHRTDVAIAFAAGDQLAAVRLRTHSHLAGARGLAVLQAESLLTRLRRVTALTPLDQTLEGIRADGSFSAAVALRAFVMAYGPLPGVPGIKGPTGAGRHATMAAAMVQRVWSQLSSAQQAAIDADLGFSTTAAAGAPATHPMAGTLTEDPAYEALTNGDDATYHGLIGGVPPITIKVYRTTEKIVHPVYGDALADAAPVDKNGDQTSGPMAYCRIRVTPLGQAENSLQLKVTLAHEAFHCVEFALNPGYAADGDWRIEGLADWASQATVPGAEADAGTLLQYYTTPRRPLFARAYDATGFWGHADEIGGKGSLWAKLPTILNAPSNEDAYLDAGATSNAFQNTWASAVWRSSAGPAWNQTDPVVLPGDSAGTDALIINDDAGLHSDPFAFGEYLVAADPDRPLVQVSSVLGGLRAAISHKDFGIVGSSDYFCAGTCTCPDGSGESTIPSHESFGKYLVLALTNGDGVGIGHVTYHSLDDYCQPSPSTGLQVRQADKLVATFTKGTCTAGGGGFHATAQDGDWSIDVRIKAFAGYGKRYTLTHGNDPVFVIKGPGGPYSNRYESPDKSPALGGISFYPGGTKMLLGYEYAWNASASNAVLPLGKMTCVKPKKH